MLNRLFVTAKLAENPVLVQKKRALAWGAPAGICLLLLFFYVWRENKKILPPNSTVSFTTFEMGA